MNKDIILTNIQRFSLHDGPGIRTTVFLKGCSLCCPWCSNPENLSTSIQTYIKDNQTGIYGLYYDTNSLYIEVMKDKSFYETNINGHDINKNIACFPGGVTFSGGECLLQIQQLEELLKKLNKEHIHITIESSLFITEKKLLKAIKYADLFYVDVKILDEKKCKNYLHGQLSIYLSNLNLLMYSGKYVVIRIPVIGGYTDGKDNRKKVADLLKLYIKDNRVNLLKVELIKEHNLGISKYKSLAACNKGYSIPDYKGVTDEFMEIYKKEIIDSIGDGIPVEVCKI